MPLRSLQKSTSTGPLPLLVGALGIVLSLVLWSTASEREDRIAELEFQSQARAHANILQAGIADHVEKLSALRALFESGDRQINRREFTEFSAHLMERYGGILELAWIPRVTREQRSSHEFAAVASGIDGYHIKMPEEGGGFRPVPDRAEYYPILYLSNRSTNVRIEGLDLNDGGFRQATLERARDIGGVATSPNFELRPAVEGFFVVAPVYRQNDLLSVEDRRLEIEGFVQVVFKTGSMIETIFATSVPPSALDYYFYRSERDDPVHFHSSRRRPAAASPLPKTEIASKLHFSIPLTVGDATWTLVAAPIPGGPGTPYRFGSWLILIGGLGLTLIAVAHLWIVRRHAAALRRQNILFDAALDNMSQGICLFNRDQKLLVSNRRYAEMYGLDPQAVRPGMTLREMFALRIANGTFSGDPQSYAKGTVVTDGHVEPSNREIEFIDGRVFRLLRRPLVGGGWVGTHEDITASKLAQARIAHMARHDPLTDLPNRTYLREHLEHAITALPRSGSLAVLGIDLDRFKIVNDTLGHPIGDKLLQAVAQRIKDCMRDGDIVARPGGDEFTILQLGTLKQPEDSAALAKRLIEVVSEPFHIDGHQVAIGVSIGVALAPTDGNDASTLLKNADMALYRAKADGRGTYRFFEQHMDAREQVRRKMELELRAGLALSHFEMYYQPIMDATSGELSCFEALVRWNHPERGLISPADFIPLAEETGLIVPLGEWVISSACVEAASWSLPVRVAVNLSPLQFKNRNLVNAVRNALQKSGLHPSRLELEITESVLLQNTESTLKTLHKLRAFGVSISMDDFGTGYSSLSYLRSFPFDKIKIDRSFIKDMGSRDDCMAIIRAVTGLGNSLGIKTTAEGVETMEQLKLLRAEGCTEVQGFLFSEPKPASEVEHMLQRFSHRTAA
jgi:diguanylate cyclase (GGDEF)-like protein